VSVYAYSYVFGRTLCGALLIFLILGGFFGFRYWKDSYCIFEKGDIQIYEPYYESEPCTWFFTISYRGEEVLTEDSNYNSFKYIVDLIISDAEHSKTLIKQRCSLDHVEDPEVGPYIEWCAKVFVPSGEWDYKFVCENGKSTDWQIFENMNTECEKINWFSEQCDSKIKFW
jgi:hypothetical protein